MQAPARRIGAVPRFDLQLELSHIVIEIPKVFEQAAEETERIRQKLPSDPV